MGKTLGKTTRGEVYVGETRLEVEACGVCGILFAAPEVLLDAARADHTMRFYCPVGHNLGYLGKSEAEKQRERADRAEERATRERAMRDQAEASARAQRGAATRARNQRDRIAGRVKNGVCPCCNRTLKDLQRHMASQHPEWKPGEE